VELFLGDGLQLANYPEQPPEDVIDAGGTPKRLRRSEVIGTVAQFPTRREAMQVLSTRLGTINGGKARAQSIRTFGDF
jgi:hypothetical protein